MVKVMSGGGITSNKYVTSRSGVKVEPKANKASPAGVNQMGLSTQFKKEPIIQGKGYEPKAMPATGVPGHYNAAKQGPGSQRTVYPSGGQSLYGKVVQGETNRAPDPPATGTRGRDILSDFGKDRR